MMPFTIFISVFEDADPYLNLTVNNIPLKLVVPVVHRCIDIPFDFSASGYFPIIVFDDLFVYFLYPVKRIL